MYNVEKIREILSERPATPIIYFYGHYPHPGRITETCLSQWFNCKFVVDGQEYHTAEQYMMMQKARLFGDDEIFNAIFFANSPREYKALGRKIKNFDDKVWNEHKYDIVVSGNKAKFSQNIDLKNYLLSTGDAILVEASPYDRIWGIGIDKETAKAGSIDDWKGQNLLGCALMDVRDYLKEI